MPTARIHAAPAVANRIQFALIARAHARGRFGPMPTVDATAARWVAGRAGMFRRFYARRAAAVA